jgi:hypothetical protein
MNADVKRALECFDQLYGALSDLGLNHFFEPLQQLQEQMIEELDIEE